MKKKVQSASWLDTLTYIIIPIVLLLGCISLVRGLSQFNFSFYYLFGLLVEVFFLSFYGYVAYYTHKRDNRAYSLLITLFWLTAIRTSLDFANTRTINNGDNFFVTFAFYLGLCYVLWIYPNQIYLKKRKDLFRNSNPSILGMLHRKKSELPSKEEEVNTIQESDNTNSEKIE